MRGLALCAFCVLVSECARPAVIIGPSEFVPSAVSVPSDARPVVACTPTQAEICFNAVDDNCNGVIDEGCGVHTGLLQFTVAWGSTAANVDLSVAVPPDGQRVPDPNGGASTSGFHLDRECPGEDACNGQNVENIYFDGSTPPRGRYVVDIALVDLHGSEPPVQVTFGARLGNRSVGFGVDLASGADSHRSFSFDLPEPGPSEPTARH
ncbi:MAG: MopE-related protein [Polyangiaceae bacterium]